MLLGVGTLVFGSGSALLMHELMIARKNSEDGLLVYGLGAAHGIMLIVTFLLARTWWQLPKASASCKATVSTAKASQKVLDAEEILPEIDVVDEIVLPKDAVSEQPSFVKGTAPFEQPPPPPGSPPTEPPRPESTVGRPADMVMSIDEFEATRRETKRGTARRSSSVSTPPNRRRQSIRSPRKVERFGEWTE